MDLPDGNAGDARRLSLDKMSPEEMPELPREITILRGAFSSLEGRVREMLDKIEPVVRPTEPSPESMKAVGADSPPVRSRYASELRQLSTEVGHLTAVVEGTLYRIEL